MSRLWFFMQALCCVGALSGQNSFPFPMDSAEWHVTRVTPIIGPGDGFDQWVYWVNGDTLVLDSVGYTAVYARGTCQSGPQTSYQYKPYTQAVYARVGALRQSGDSVFFRRLSYPAFPGMPSTLGAYPVNAEVVLYDFSLEPGDTIAYVTPDRVFVVQSVTLDGKGRKEILLSSFGCGYPIQVIWREGQGCLNGLLETICIYYYANSCFSNGALDDPPCTLPCTPADPVLVPVEDERNEVGIRVYPNPSSGEVYLELNDIPMPVEVDVMDALGRLVGHQQADDSSRVIRLPQVPPGLYQIVVTGQDGQRWATRLVRSD